MHAQDTASESRFYPGMETNPWKGVEDAVALIRVDIAQDFEVPAIS